MERLSGRVWSGVHRVFLRERKHCRFGRRNCRRICYAASSDCYGGLQCASRSRYRFPISYGESIRPWICVCQPARVERREPYCHLGLQSCRFLQTHDAFLPRCQGCWRAAYNNRHPVQHECGKVRLVRSGASCYRWSARVRHTERGPGARLARHRIYARPFRSPVPCERGQHIPSYERFGRCSYYGEKCIWHGSDHRSRSRMG